MPMTAEGKASWLRSSLFYALRSFFRVVPAKQNSRDAMRSWFLDRFPSVRPNVARGEFGATAEHRPRKHSGGRALGYVERRDEPLPDPLPATLVAFYLPQFHVIPENDQWWGKGFTEWRNVARALPQFEGHAQPRLPGQLGFYDLSNPQVMRDQAELAKAYGIGAFCFYYYWFSGKTLLEAPIRQWLGDPSITLPFCLCWANESWSRRWDGRPTDILIAQDHSPEDDLAFIANIACYLGDPRYLRVDNKPLLLVYRPHLLPDAAATADRWRAWCRTNGIGEIYIAYVQSFERPNPADIGFDAAVEFPPNLSVPTDVTARQRLINPHYRGQTHDWRELASDYSARRMPGYPLFPGVNCGWDNEPRRPGQGRSFLHTSPRGYRDWLQSTILKRLPLAEHSHGLIFINAWNEWAEGAVLEPDSRLGCAWLQATRDALHASTCSIKTIPEPVTSICIVIHAWYLEPLREILETISTCDLGARLVITTTFEKQAEVRRLLAIIGTEAQILVSENRGRDILPFLRVAYALADDGTAIILKLHTKKSVHAHDGDAWRRSMIETLLNPVDVTRIISSFESNPKLGLIAPGNHLLPVEDYIGANARGVDYLRRRLGFVGVGNDSAEFPSGSMYWVRPDALRTILDAHLDESEFEPEAGQTDGTLAHAVERIIAHAVQQRGYDVVRWPTNQAGNQLPPGAPYPFARRTRA